MDVTKLFERGSEAFERANWQLAIVVWQQLLAMDPDHARARKLLRTAEMRKWVQEGRGRTDKLMAAGKGLGATVNFLIHMLTKSYDRAIIDSEKYLMRDPTCGLVLWGLVWAATKGEHIGAAVVTMEYMHERQPKNVTVLRQLGRLYEEQGEIERSIDAWNKLKAIVPSDREAQTKLRDLAATKTMADGKYEKATEKGSSYRQLLKDKDEAEDLEDKQHIIRSDDDLQRAIDRVTKDVEENPTQKRYAIQLGDLHRRAKDLGKAREFYLRAQNLDPMDFSIPERIGELGIDEFSLREQKLADKLAAEPQNGAAKARLEALRKEKFDFSLTEYRRQVHVRPTDAALRA
jgi:tetratricopeptide (TPR) repeat protein